MLSNTFGLCGEVYRVHTRADYSAKQIEELRVQLARKLDGGATIPTLPEIAMEILRLVGDKNAGLNDFSDVIQADQSLTGKLLKLSNSAYFAQQKPVTNLKRALVLLGIERLKAIALGFRLADSIGGGQERSKRLWNVALFRAWLSLRVAEELDVSRSGESFIAGLLLDVGEWFMPDMLEDAYTVVGAETNSPARRYRIETENLPFNHVDVADAIARCWKLPDELRTPIVEHHTPALTVAEGGDIVRAVAYWTGQMALDPAQQSDPSSGQLRIGERLFDIRNERLAELVTYAREDFEGTQQMFAKVLSDQLSAGDIERQARSALVDVTADLVEDALVSDQPAIEVQVGSLTYAIESAADPDAVQVYISDASGAKLMSEQISPSSLTPAQLRTRLMLDRASDDEFASLYDSIQRIAA